MNPEGYCQESVPINSTFGILYPSTCNFGWCFLFSSLYIFKYTVCFGLTGHLHAYNCVCRPFKVTVTAARSVLGWQCIDVPVFRTWGLSWSNALSLQCEAVLDVFVSSEFNLLCFVLFNLSLTISSVTTYSILLRYRAPVLFTWLLHANTMGCKRALGLITSYFSPFQWL
jgi:hypothetical protein